MNSCYKHPKPVLGMLGAPGAGKSTLAKLLSERGGRLIDADQIAKDQLCQPEIIQTLENWWGPDILTDTGNINRQAVAQVVFKNPEARQQLEALIHPRVHAEREKQRQQAWENPSILFIIEDCPLLLEMGLEKACDVLIMADAPEKIRLDRLKKHRGWSASHARQREGSQMPLDIKRQHADYIVDTTEPVSIIRHQLDQILARILGQLP